MSTNHFIDQRLVLHNLQCECIRLTKGHTILQSERTWISNHLVFAWKFSNIYSRFRLRLLKTLFLEILICQIYAFVYPKISFLNRVNFNKLYLINTWKIPENNYSQMHLRTRIYKTNCAFHSIVLWTPTRLRIYRIQLNNVKVIELI